MRKRIARLHGLVRDGLGLIIEAVDVLLSCSTGERRQVLEGYHQKLADVLCATEPGSSK